MFKTATLLLVINTLLCFNSTGIFAQYVNVPIDIDYSSPKKYTIAGIEISGINYLDKDRLKAFTGLSIGQEIEVPGTEISNAIRGLWQRGLFSDVNISVAKEEGKQIWLDVELTEIPRLTSVEYKGLKKNEKEDIDKKLSLIPGQQVTENSIVSAERLIKAYFSEKGYLNTDVVVVRRDDPNSNNSIILNIDVDKNEKVKVDEIVFHGNSDVKSFKLERAMKKTNSKDIRNFFKSKKFQEALYKDDKGEMIKKFNELGYRDAIVLRDSITRIDDKNIKLDIWVDEGDKYYIRDIKWVGNTKYPAFMLDNMLGIKKGDVFDQKLLNKRLQEDDDAVSSLYLDNGYVFSNITPIETNVAKDSIDFEMRIIEGSQATINEVKILGNTKTNEHVVRRELYTKPGDLFSKSDIKRSLFRIAGLGHFDENSLIPDIVPNPESGTVDVSYNLTERENDQLELSGGYGANRFIFSAGVRFNNFSIRNIFNPDSYKPLPSGDGQTLALKAQVSGKYMQSYSITFVEPWLGGKKPNNFSVNLSYYKYNYSENSYYEDFNTAQTYNNYYNNYSNYYNYYGGSSYGGTGDSYTYDGEGSDGDKIQETFAIGVGYGYRLKWPDDYFTVNHYLSFERYMTQNLYQNFQYYVDPEGKYNVNNYNNLSFNTVFGRNSVDYPIYPRSGSSYSLGVKFTFPYSLFSNMPDEENNPDAYDTWKEKRLPWLEYYQFTLKGEKYMPLSSDNKLVLMAKFEGAFLGYYNKHLISPYERFNVGGSGLSGSYMPGTSIVSQRGYEDGMISANATGSQYLGAGIYTKYTMELRYPVSLEQQATIYLLTFLEAGNAWAGMDASSFKSFDPFDLKRAAGAGVRIYLPIFGMMGVDWGYGFDKVLGETSGSQFHFIIGQSF
ncbi:MAG: outer membrane protein assembly factor [Bacteroidales bacterium]